MFQLNVGRNETTLLENGRKLFSNLTSFYRFNYFSRYFVVTVITFSSMLNFIKTTVTICIIFYPTWLGQGLHLYDDTLRVKLP